ncbi:MULTISPECIES: 30S ribosomal protein S2 [unclassified Aureispira]|uniref:30S ribosomal protein S2 n=1 Tax=unclassified Aureispira TaxID=2649989 RepID=UPI0006976496|nr:MULTISPECIES: 30S ribosomal protein S2 [unclassified Aureispira]WMX14889.1 30S ribosomal protein S2 [Aureispira sp. CCB-E]
MQTPSHKELLDAGCHFGHMKRKWNPKMSPYIFMERKGIHVIDLNRTIEGLETAAKALRQMAKSGKKIMFVGTKKQAREIISEAAQSVGMPYVTDRWLGGMMTNFSTIRQSIRKMQKIQTMLNDGSLDNITKKERLTMTRTHTKLERVFGGMAQLNRLPNALLILDINHEHLAVAEATRLGIKTVGVVDTNSDPTKVDFAIPANDDASKSIKIITDYLVAAIKEGLAERSQGKDEKAKTEETSA